MSHHHQVRNHLQHIEQQMRLAALWQSQPPAAEDFNSPEPFSIGTLTAEQWLQWIFLPRMQALLDQQAPLPQRFSITPYLEEVFKTYDQDCSALLAITQQLDDLLNQES